MPAGQETFFSIHLSLRTKFPFGIKTNRTPQIEKNISFDTFVLVIVFIQAVREVAVEFLLPLPLPLLLL